MSSPYTESWADFAAEAEQLYRAAPLKASRYKPPARLIQPDLPRQARFCTKYRPAEGVLTLKVTDDVRVRCQRPG